MDSDSFHTDFCPACGGLIELETISDAIKCQICGSHRSFEQFAGMDDWMQVKQCVLSCMQGVIRSGFVSMREVDTVSSERCPKCDNPELKYYVMQTRSVDEGSTVFYECQKCSYTFSVNN